MSRDPFPFVLDELQPIRPTVKRAFGLTYVYFDDKLLCCLRDSEKLTAAEVAEKLGKPLVAETIRNFRTGR